MMIKLLLKCAICFSIFFWYALPNFCMQIPRPLAHGVRISSKASATLFFTAAVGPRVARGRPARVDPLRPWRPRGAVAELSYFAWTPRYRTSRLPLAQKLRLVSFLLGFYFGGFGTPGKYCTYLTSLPLVSVRHHGRVNSQRVNINFTSSASSICLVHNVCCEKYINERIWNYWG